MIEEHTPEFDYVIINDCSTDHTLEICRNNNFFDIFPLKALQQFLRPEFINRVDEVICFNRLDEKNFAGIAHIMLDELQKSLEDKGLHFTWDEDVEDYLVKKSYSATYGARNLRRTIQKELEDVMAAQIIDSYEHPVTQIHASMEDGKLVVRSL